MAILDTLARAVAIVGTGAFGFVIGLIAWAGLSGVLAGFLDSFGIVIPASAFISLGPIAGGAVAIVVVMMVFE